MTIPGRIGLLGGTFDPVHIAHLHIAACARAELDLDEVRFIPAGNPPHKPGMPVTDGVERLRMLEIATADIDGFAVDPLDLDADRPSYTSELLARMRQAEPSAQLWFIVGGDSLAEFHTWHEPRAILDLARLAVATRPGWDLDVTKVSSSVAGLADRIDVFSSVPIDLSATVIRNRLRDGLPVDWLLPDAVRAYIRLRGLYPAPGNERR